MDNKRRSKQRRGQEEEGSKEEDRSAPSCLSASLLPSSFVVCLLDPKKTISVVKVLVHYCFLVFRPAGEYISLDLFYRDENFTVSTKKSAYPTPAGFTRAFRFCIHFC